MNTIKVGRIDFLNILPIYHYLDQYSSDIQLIQKVPSALNRLLQEGELDVGPISSFSYAENADQYVVFPNLSVSSIGKVRSIFLFSKRPIEQLHGAKIALTNTSATSIHLLKVLLEKYHSCYPTYSVMPPDLPSMLAEHDGALLIGDDAFVDPATYQTPLYRYDLGEMWNALTDCSMTFAVWAVRKDAIERDHAGLVAVYEAFIRSKEQGLANLDQVIQAAEEKFPRGYQFWKDYYSGLNYDFNPSMIEGLNRFFADCHECGYLKHPVQTEVWGDVIE